MTTTENQKPIVPQKMAPAEKKSYLRIILIVLVILQFLCLGGLGWLYYDLLNQHENLQAELSVEVTEKDRVEMELQELLSQYKGLETDNEQLSGELEAEKNRIEELIKELKQTKASNYAKIKEYKDELETLRSIMKSYIVQIDSLNTVAEVYKTKYNQAEKNYTETKIALTELNVEKEQLTEKVEAAAVLKAVNFNAIAINAKSKPVTKVRKVDKFKVCFTIRENVLAESGAKFVYIRISKPDGLVIINSEENQFQFEESMIAFTEKRELKYENQDIDMCIYWKKTEELKAGTYKVDIFADGNQIGSTSFDLK